MFVPCLSLSPVEQTAVGIIALVYDRPRGGPKSDVVECTSHRHGVVLAQAAHSLRSRFRRIGLSFVCRSHVC